MIDALCRNRAHAGCVLRGLRKPRPFLPIDPFRNGFVLSCSVLDAAGQAWGATTCGAKNVFPSPVALRKILATESEVKARSELMILARSGNDFLHRLRWEPALVFDPRQTFLLYSHLKNAIFDERSGGVVAGVNPENFLLRRSSCSVLLSATDKDSRVGHRSSHRRHQFTSWFLLT